MWVAGPVKCKANWMKGEGLRNEIIKRMFLTVYF